MTVSIGLGPIFSLVVGWVGLGWVTKMDPLTTLVAMFSLACTRQQHLRIGRPLLVRLRAAAAAAVVVLLLVAEEPRPRQTPDSPAAPPGRRRTDPALGVVAEGSRPGRRAVRTTRSGTAAEESPAPGRGGKERCDQLQRRRCLECPEQAGRCGVIRQRSRYYSDITNVTSCCSSDSDRPHRCCHLVNDFGSRRIFCWGVCFPHKRSTIQ